MSTHKNIDKICLAVLAVTLIITVLFMNAEAFGVVVADRIMGYEDRLFDSSYVHTLNIVIDDWDTFLSTATSEEYSECSVVIDNEAYKNVAIRAKGNTSLSSVASYGNNRYSFKLEFDHYDSTKTYHGLDKLSLNNIIQDNTYMKDFLAYTLMNKMGVVSSLCSFVYITVNGEDWGLYLAVEGVEDSFLERNYGSDAGELYKPDSMSMGGGIGNGKDFNFDDWNTAKTDGEDTTETETNESGFNPFGGGGNGGGQADITPPDNSDMPEMPDGQTMPNMPDNIELPDGIEMPDDIDVENMPDMSDLGGGNGGFSMGSDDVSLIYSDDNASSYSNIFNNAKTDITEEDEERLIEALKNLNNLENLEETVNVEQVIKYFTVHNFLVNFDSYTGSMIHNYYLYEDDGMLSMIPWDYNLAFGGFESSADATSLVNYPIDTPVSGGDVSSRPMLAWIFSDEEYTEMYHEYFAEFIEEVFTSGYFEELFDNTVDMISEYVAKDPTKFCTYEEFTKGVQTLKAFCLKRAESIEGQLDGTIPSTSDGQKADDSTLVDASELTVSDMGSMNNGGGMGGDNKGGMTMPDNIGDMKRPDEESSTDNTETSEDGTGGNTSPEKPDGQSNPMENNDRTIKAEENTDSETAVNPEGNTNSDMQNIPDDAKRNESDTDFNPSDFDFSDFNPTDMDTDKNIPYDMEGTNSTSADTYILLGASVALLVIGLLVAKFYKRRK